MAREFLKSPGDVLDYVFDFAAETNGRDDEDGDWLASGETIASISSVTADTGLTIDSSSITDSNTSVTVWLSGGTADNNYTVTCKIVTSTPRTVEKTIEIKVKEEAT